MFPLAIISIRAALIRAADLALRLLTLEAVRLPDGWFAPGPEPAALACADAPRRSLARRQRPARGNGHGGALAVVDTWTWPSRAPLSSPETAASTRARRACGTPVARPRTAAACAQDRVTDLAIPRR